MRLIEVAICGFFGVPSPVSGEGTESSQCFTDYKVLQFTRLLERDIPLPPNRLGRDPVHRIAIVSSGGEVGSGAKAHRFRRKTQCQIPKTKSLKSFPNT